MVSLENGVGIAEMEGGNLEVGGWLEWGWMQDGISAMDGDAEAVRETQSPKVAFLAHDSRDKRQDEMV
jgi:hypothetical protein